VGQNNYGASLRDGTGVAQDDVKAVEYFRMSANQKEKNGLYNYAWCLETGTGVGLDRARAAKYYKKAEDAGSADAHAGYVRCTT
jgi:TPR repeat protein